MRQERDETDKNPAGNRSSETRTEGTRISETHAVPALALVASQILSSSWRCIMALVRGQPTLMSGNRTFFATGSEFVRLR